MTGFYNARRFMVGLIAIVTVLIYSCFVYALDEEITDKYATDTPPEKTIEEDKEEYLPPPEFIGEVNINGAYDFQQGYDNNIDLDPSRHKDGFFQTLASVEAVYRPIEAVRLRTGLDVFDTIYYKYNSNNILDVTPYIGVDYELLPGVISRNRITYDYFHYPNKKESTFSALELYTSVRHFIMDDLYHELSYEFSRRWYADRKINLEDSSRGNKDRRDDRHKLKYRIRWFTDKFSVKLDNELQFNDSNDEYQEYYDYTAYRLRPSVMYFITEKLYTNLSLLYKRTVYDNRRSTEDASRKVRDNTYIITSALYYDIVKNITLEFSYSYTENDSNDPFQKYSGSILSGGLYYSF